MSQPDYEIQITGPDGATKVVNVFVFRIGNRLATRIEAPLGLCDEERTCIAIALQTMLTAVEGVPVKIAAVTRDVAETRRFMGGGQG